MSFYFRIFLAIFYVMEIVDLFPFVLEDQEVQDHVFEIHNQGLERLSDLSDEARIVLPGKYYCPSEPPERVHLLT